MLSAGEPFPCKRAKPYPAAYSNIGFGSFTQEIRNAISIIVLDRLNEIGALKRDLIGSEQRNQNQPRPQKAEYQSERCKLVDRSQENLR
jgi:hypothetical protein